MYIGSLIYIQYGPSPFADPESFFRGRGSKSKLLTHFTGGHVLMYLYYMSVYLDLAIPLSQNNKYLSGKGHPRAAFVKYVLNWSSCYDSGGQKVDIAITYCQRGLTRVTSKTSSGQTVPITKYLTFFFKKK